MSGAVAVLDVGKTNVKLALFSRQGETLWERSQPNRPLPAPPYLHTDIEAIWAFFRASLAEAARLHRIDAIVPTAHGAAAVLVDDQGLALPMLDYEETQVESIEPSYAPIRPPFAKSYSPPAANGLNVGRQLAWQKANFPEGFARARYLLFYPQYWAWRMSGVAANEFTSVACHTDLWLPAEARASDLVAALGMVGRLPPLVPAWRALGPLKREIADAAGLAPNVPVLCGVHDSNASIVPYLAHWRAPFTVVSTGTSSIPAPTCSPMSTSPAVQPPARASWAGANTPTSRGAISPRRHRTPRAPSSLAARWRCRRSARRAGRSRM